MRWALSDSNSKRRRLPESGQWPDKLMVPAIIAAAVFSTAGFLDAMLRVGPVNGASVNGFALIGGQVVDHVQLLSQKIFYFHMPVAIVSFVLLVFAAYYCVRYLVSRELRFDTCAQVAMEVSLLFVILTMVTGDLWTRFEWGVWWTWDPRLTTYLILMLIIIAYFILRNAVDEPERRATYCSVIGVIAFVDVPICFMITRLIPSSLHPVVTRQGGMTGDMAAALALCLIGMLLAGFVLYRARFAQVRVDQRVQALKDELALFEEEGRAGAGSADVWPFSDAPLAAEPHTQPSGED